MLAGEFRQTPVTRHIEAPASKRIVARAFPFMPAADRLRNLMPLSFLERQSTRLDRTPI
jgi:hypothetical protein